MSMVRGSVLILGLSFAVGCGAKATTPASTETTPASEPAPTSSWEPPPLPTDTPAVKALGISAPTDKPWDSMSYDEKEWYMVGKVHPVMREIFQTLDHDKYEGMKFECAPCHGENAAEKKYKMPSDHLSPVPAAGTEDWKAMQGARMVKFMAQRVTPSMAALLGKQSGEPGAGDAFSCWGCHPKQ